MADNYSLFKDKVDFNHVVEKNLSAAHELEKHILGEQYTS